MYKLLPEEAREGIKREYLLRRTAIMLAAFILVLVVAIVGLFPSYSLSKARQKEVGDRVQAISTTSQGKDLESWVSSINLRLKALSPKLDQDRPASIIAVVVEEKVDGIKLTNFRWVKNEGGGELSVSGVARDRQALLSFESRLKGSEEFSSVSLPISNLAKDKDINFELKLSTVKKP